MGERQVCGQKAVTQYGLSSFRDSLVCFVPVRHDRLAFVGIDLGSLAMGGKLQQFPGGPLPALNLIRLS